MNRTTVESLELPAFFDCVESSGFVVLWLQHGDECAAERTLAAVSRAFCAQSGKIPSDAWPARFWRLLAVTPCLSSRQRHWPPSLQRLAEIDDPPRRALLLRLAGKLREQEAAAAMGIEVDAYERLLALACPRDGDGKPDAAAWRQLADTIHRMVRQLLDEPVQAARLRRVRAAAFSGRPIEPEHLHATPLRAQTSAVAAGCEPTSSRSAPQRRGAGRMRGKRKIGRRAMILVLLVVMLVVLTVGAFYRRAPGPDETVSMHVPEIALEEGVSRVIDPGPIRVEILPPETTRRALHAMADGMAPTPAFVSPVPELAFFSWYAAGMPGRQIDHETPPAPPSVSPAGPPRLKDDPVQDRLIWESLASRQQRRVREAVAAFSGLPPTQQHALRTDFIDRDGLERRGWLLGPELGSHYIALQPLFGLVPEGQRRPLLNVLHDLDAQQIRQLAILAQRVSPQDRDKVRRDLLVVAPRQRNDWLSQRLQ